MEHPSSGQHGLAIEILDRLASRHDQLADQVFTAVTAEIGDYGSHFGQDVGGSRDSAGFWDDVRDFGDAHIREAMKSARTDGIPEPQVLDFVREVTIRRIDQGVPLDAILHAFRVGHRVVWGAVLAEADTLSNGREAVVELTVPFMRYVDAVSTCIAATYVTQQHRMEAAADRAARNLLEMLMTADEAAPDAARSAGLQVEDPHLVMVGTAPGDSEGLRRLEEDLLSTFDRQKSLVVIKEGEVTCLIPVGQDEPDEVAEQCRLGLLQTSTGRSSQYKLGISVPCEGLAGIAPAHQQARAALALASGETPVVYLGGMEVLDYLVAKQDQVASALIPNAVQELADSDGVMDRALVETLFAYVESDMNVKRTAAILPAHPNTVHYRLNRLDERTGRSHRNVRQMTELAVTVRLARAETG